MYIFIVFFYIQYSQLFPENIDIVKLKDKVGYKIVKSIPNINFTLKESCKSLRINQISQNKFKNS